MKSCLSFKKIKGKYSKGAHKEMFIVPILHENSATRAQIWTR